jgi:hypothetical protein
LRSYATHLRVPLSKLRLIDVTDGVGDLHPDFVKFIESTKPGPRQTQERHKESKQENKSRVGRIVKTFSHGSAVSEETGAEMSYAGDVPEFMHKVLDELPRVGGRSATSHWPGGRERRRLLPLTANGSAILVITLKVVERHNLTSHLPIFLEHRAEVSRLIRESFPPNRWYHLDREFRTLKSRLGIPPVIRRRDGLESLPPTLASQCGIYLNRVVVGLRESAPELADVAAGYGINVEGQRAAGIRCYEDALISGFKYIPSAAGKDLGVEDLMQLVPVSRIERGKTITELRNPYIEELRAHRRSESGRNKAKGFDAGSFALFLCALKAVAAYNGIFEYHESFTTAYKVKLDKKTREDRKKEKKRAFDIKWIDEQIAVLRQHFVRIANDGSFRFGQSEYPPGDPRRNIKLCLFYVNLVALRYLGYRQQCIRNCVLGLHIKFIGKTIYFHWDAGEIKNANEIEGHLTKGADDELHGVLIEALWLHYKKIYPFIKEHSGEAIRGNFFVKLGQNKFQPFRLDRPNDFTEVFNRDGWDFIEFDGRLEFDKRRLNPHFFRGLACDWLKEKGASNKAIADYVGDTERVVDARYLRKDLPRSNRAAIEEIMGSVASRGKDEEAIVGLREELKAKEQLLQSLLKSMEASRKQEEARAARDADRIASLETQVAALSAGDQRQGDILKRLEDLERRARAGAKPAVKGRSRRGKD